MKTVVRTLDSRPLFLVMAVFLSYLLAVNFWPASFWFEVRQVSAGPAAAGQTVPMLVNRTIHRAFTGTWHVSVKRFGEKGWVAHCNATGTSNYTPTSELPKFQSLGWWTYGACPTLPPGKYIVETSWTIQPILQIFPTKYVKAGSNIFEVTP